ncbi:hypothetical protein BSLG_006209 [Batrachochytrium salamandrivorans]|nr:hypothetical protein BSLG_006209 [Batrachochytrium salamandrivorans]
MNGQPKESRMPILIVAMGVGAVSLLLTLDVIYNDATVTNSAIGLTSLAAIDAATLSENIAASLKYPGVYIWGSNRGGLVQPSHTTKLDQPVAIESLQGCVLRDLAFSDTHAAAIDEHGDLLQWGRSISTDQPKPTLSKRNLVQVSCASHKTYTLSRSGIVYEIDSDASSSSVVALKLPSSAAWGERICMIACGANHLIAVSTSGHAYAYACDGLGNKCGQLGLGHADVVPVQSPVLQRIPGLTRCDKVAAGRAHTVVGTSDGRVFGFGLNRFGQLGIGSSEDLIVSAPVEITTIWSGRHSSSNSRRNGDSRQPSEARCTQIAAGGDTTLFVVDTNESTRVMACGNGQFGQLGTGAYHHIMPLPKCIKPISDLVEYDPRSSRVIPIRVAKVCVGDSHCAVVMANSINGHDSKGSWVKYLSGVWTWMVGRPSCSDTNGLYGRDVLVWGLNVDGQLRRADSKRGSLASPGYVLPIEYGHLQTSGMDGDTVAATRTQPSDDGAAETQVGNIRLQLATNATAMLRSGRHRVSQDIVLGPNLTAVYTRSSSWK